MMTFCIVLGCVLAVLGVFYLVISHDYRDAVVPVPDKADTARNPYIVPTGRTMVAAHRLGGGISPENTLMALKNCVEVEALPVDIFEFDVHLTKDNQLILLHDETFDRTSNAEEAFGRKGVLPHEKTYEELQVLNLGEHFKTASGDTPYKGLRGDDIPPDLHVARLRDVFAYFRDRKSYGFVIEIKDGKALGRRAADELYAALQEYDMLRRVVVGTFHGEITAYMEETSPDMLRSAGIREVAGFYFSSLFGIRHKPDHYHFDALQIPTNDYVFQLGTSRLVNYAHKYNIAVQYWTINDPAEVRLLAAIGADAIMSDHPEMASRELRG